jgi:hypothetical protein
MCWPPFLGGAILTFLFFLIREKIFGFADMNGSWVYEQETKTSDYNPYKGITLRYLVLLAQDGNQIYGSAEKIYEMTADGKTKDYVGKQRSRAEITGHIAKRYFSKDVISIHIKENGALRVSSTFQVLECKSNNQLQGRFSSTIANQVGSVEWSRRSS